MKTTKTIHQLTKEELITLIKNSKTSEALAESLGTNRKEVYRKRKQHNILDIAFGSELNREKTFGEKVVFSKKIETEEVLSDLELGKLELMKQRHNEVLQQLKKVQKELAIKDEELNGMLLIKNSFDYRGKGQPDWLTYTKSGNKTLSIPTLMCSDEHWGEVVFPNQVNGVNEYNSEIARSRFNNVYNNYLEVCNQHLNNVDTSKMVLVLGGDNVSGDIHEELSQTNDLTTMEAVYDYVDHKEKAIRELLVAGFKQIFVPCVTGNHDRLTKKIQGKMRNETSCAYLVYRFLQKCFAGDNRVQFSIAGGIDLLYQVNSHRMLLTHGDQFKGGNGIGGITIPILRGFHKKQTSFAATGNHFDSMIIGHFHQFTSIANGQVIINGSSKGYDEYSQRMGFTYQDPCQAFWLTTPDRGITIQLPIYCESKSPKTEEWNPDDWVSWKK